jgi:RND family efflux transporter MFP subunit
VDSHEAGTGKVHSIRQARESSDERLLWSRFREAASPEAFYDSWLAIQCHMIEGVVAGLLLAAGASGSALSPAAVWPAGARPGRHLAAAAEKVLKERRAVALQLDPQGGAAAAGASHTVVAQPVEVEGELTGVVVLEVSPRAREALEQALRYLAWGSAWLELSALTGAAGGGRKGETLESLFDLVATPLEHERFRASSTAFATELATRFGCDRASLGFVARGRVKLCAVSHSALFSERANLTRSIEAAMEEALDQETTVVWPSPPDAPPRVDREHAQLAAVGESGAICSLPMAHGARFCGVVTLERAGDEPFRDSELRLIEAAVAMAGPMLDIQRRDDRWLVAKAVESVHQTLSKLVGPRYVALKLGAGVIVLVVALMSLVKADFRVTADMTLEAKVLRAAVAPFDGYVEQAPMRAGDEVEKGDLLAALDDRELVLERTRWSSQLEQLRKRHRQALAKRDAAQVRVLTAQIDQSEAQLSLVTDQLAKTRIVAPFDGFVVTGDLSQQLGAPVQRGELLFEVAPLDAYRVVLDVDERDIDEVRVGQVGDLVFSASPGDSSRFTVEKITPVSTPQEGQNTFRVEARLDAALGQLQPGMEGVGKIEIDRRLLIWIWTHEVVDWLRLKLWNWLP